MKYFIGIDPGASGSMCILGTDNSIVFVDFSKTNLRGYIDALPSTDDILMAAVESVHSMPGQGVKSVFSFGQRLGELEGMLQTRGIGYEKPTPQIWQKALSIPAKSGKEGTHSVISKIYQNAELITPRGRIIDGRCDALSIAHYLRLKYNKET
jgi:crossover junction endodeoxyribonuclease RuvC